MIWKREVLDVALIAVGIGLIESRTGHGFALRLFFCALGVAAIWAVPSWWHG